MRRVIQIRRHYHYYHVALLCRCTHYAFRTAMIEAKICLPHVSVSVRFSSSSVMAGCWLQDRQQYALPAVIDCCRAGASTDTCNSNAATQHICEQSLAGNSDVADLTAVQVFLTAENTVDLRKSQTRRTSVDKTTESVLR